ncbi:MAG: hypothetical protein Q8Q95_04115 [bacterium]|nr:hypothetical protein [bacterium]
MKDSSFHPEELTIQDKSPLGSSYAETFVFAPSNKDEAELGSLFIVAEASSNKTRKENAELTSEVATVIKNEYYQNTLVTPMSALKFSLKRVNTLLNSKKNWLTPSSALKLKVLIASLKENKLHMARMGDATAFLLRDNILQLIATTPNLKNINPLSFENIISGELLTNDHILLATNQIYKIDEKEISKKLQEKNLASYLSKTNTGIKSLALISLHPFKDGNPSLKQTPTKPSLISINTEANIPDYGPPSKNKGKMLKLGLVIIILIVTISVITITSLKIRNETSQNKKEAEQLLGEVSDIKNKINDLIAANNETEANELWLSAQEKLKHLAELNYFKTTRSTLSADLDKIYKELSKAEAINKITKVFDLENNSVGFEPEKIALGKNKIFVLGRENFYKFDFNKADGVFDSVEKGSKLVTSLLKPENPNSQILITEDKIIEEFGDAPDKTYWIRPENIPAVRDAAFYGKAIYLLTENGLIHKMPFTLSSSTPTIGIEAPTQSIGAENLVFEEIQIWTKTEENKLQSFSIEGSVFGLLDENTLAELTNGVIKNKKDFSENISQVFTSPLHKNVYLFSPDYRLVIILDKNLNIKKRLSHDELIGAKSFFVNSQERIIYFLKNKTVYSFEI